jgi:hypothetical protein
MNIRSEIPPNKGQIGGDRQPGRPDWLGPLFRFWRWLLDLLGIRNGQIDALERWETGHHLFSILIQALIVVHKQLARGIEVKDWNVVDETLTEATQLWFACAAAFHFTGDFPRSDFQTIVRPSMEPPHEREGFSGLFSPDHAVLLQVIEKLRPLLLKLPVQLKRRHRNYLWALDAMYESHAWVCQLQVGNKPSLKAKAAGDDIPAPEKIRKLKTRTLKSAGQTT